MKNIEKYWSNARVEPSFTEAIIMRKLDKFGIKYLREVAFVSCRNSRTGAHMRYDFFIPSLRIILEYDGKAYHVEENTKMRDSEKDKYAKDFGIKLIRISGINNISAAIDRVVGIKRKRQANKRRTKKILTPDAPDKKKQPKTQAEIKELILRSKAFINTL